MGWGGVGAWGVAEPSVQEHDVRIGFLSLASKVVEEGCSTGPCCAEPQSRERTGGKRNDPKHHKSGPPKPQSPPCFFERVAAACQRKRLLWPMA